MGISGEGYVPLAPPPYAPVPPPGGITIRRVCWFVRSFVDVCVCSLVRVFVHVFVNMCFGAECLENGWR